MTLAGVCVIYCMRLRDISWSVRRILRLRDISWSVRRILREAA